ncbi:hypothetical protein FRC04_008200 [Tulasnella sp. 424]|nr:hypothetical protein FRC04_008200 [Tulasnella sp. 424]
MPPRLSPLSKAGLARQPHPNSYSGWSGNWPQAPQPLVDPVMVVMIVLYVASLFLAGYLKFRREQREERERGICTCGGRRAFPQDSVDVEVANGSGYTLVQRTSSDSDDDDNDSQLDLPLSTAKISDETNSGRSDVPLGPPPSYSS